MRWRQPDDREGLLVFFPDVQGFVIAGSAHHLLYICNEPNEACSKYFSYHITLIAALGIDLVLSSANVLCPGLSFK